VTPSSPRRRRPWCNPRRSSWKRPGGRRRPSGRPPPSDKRSRGRLPAPTKKRGFARATTKEIAQTAGLAEGTIYRHFADKYALFHEIFLSLAGDIMAELARFPERAGQGTVRDNLEHLLGLVGPLVDHTASLMASMSADPEVARSFAVYVQQRAPDGLTFGPVAIVAEYIRAEQKLGRIRNDVDASEAAAVVASGAGVLDILARGLGGC